MVSQLRLLERSPKLSVELLFKDLGNLVDEVDKEVGLRLRDEKVVVKVAGVVGFGVMLRLLIS